MFLDTHILFIFQKFCSFSEKSVYFPKNFMFWKSGYFVKIRDFKHFGLNQAAIPGITVTDPSQATNLRVFNHIIYFVVLPPEFQGGVVVHPSRIGHKFYLLFSSEITNHSRDLCSCLSV